MPSEFSLDQQLAKIAEVLREPAGSITDYLKDQLDRAVASRSGDAERLRFLAIEKGKWALRMREFYRDGVQPFGQPHPVYGPMSAGDFIIVIGMIDGALAAIKARMPRMEVMQ